MLKNFMSIILTFIFLFSGTVFAQEISEPPIEADTDIVADDLNEYDYLCECDNSKEFLKLENIRMYTIPEDERVGFYDDFTTIQRSGPGDAYVVMPIPYASKLQIDSYYYGGESFETFELFLSKDEKEWTEAVFTYETVSEPNKWDCVYYTIDEIEQGTGFLKIVFPKGTTWWNPLINKIHLKTEESIPQRIEIQSPERFAIPRFETKEYKLLAVVFDQMNNPVDAPVIWELEEWAEPLKGTTLSSDGVLTLTSEAREFWRYDVTVSCPEFDLTEQWIFALQNALLGDFNYDFVIDGTELDYALSVYKSSYSDEDELIRLIDINEDSIIDVYDIAYIARNQTETEEDNPTDDTEENSENILDSESDI